MVETAVISTVALQTTRGVGVRDVAPVASDSGLGRREAERKGGYPPSGVGFEGSRGTGHLACENDTPATPILAPFASRLTSRLVSRPVSRVVSRGVTRAPGQPGI